MKIFFRNIHLYLSLAAGLVIMTCCFTGAVLVFEKELMQLFNQHRYFVQQEKNQLPATQIIAAVQQKYPIAKIAGYKVYANPERSVEIGIALPEKSNLNKKGPSEKNSTAKQSEKKPGNLEKRGPSAGAGIRQTHTVFVNPYNAQVLELYTYRESFFYTMFALHRWLLGGNDSIGKTITGIATFIFLFILITGIVLWWPRNKAILKQRLVIKNGVSWKRLNHDLHIVLGFYSAILLFIFAFTALNFSFKWFNDGVNNITGANQKPIEPLHAVYFAGQQKISYDSVLMIARQQFTTAEYFSIKPPKDSIRNYSISIVEAGANENTQDNYYIDPYNGSIAGSQKYSDKTTGQKLRASFKPIHVGSIYGWPSKILAFLVCIAGVSFPITGTIIWLNRLKKTT